MLFSSTIPLNENPACRAAAKAMLQDRLRHGFNLVRRAEAHGLILRSMFDSVAFCPPLIIDEAEIHEMFQRFSRALDDTLRSLRDEGLASVA